jgi:DUF4097 and DUF4098 domain-containing protein YvlB
MEMISMSAEMLPPAPEKPKRTLEGDVIEGSPDSPVYGAPIEYGPRKAKIHPAAPRQKRSCALTLLFGCLGGCCLCCILPFCCTVGGFGAIAAVFDENKVQSTFTDTVEVPKGEIITVQVKNEIGDIIIQPGVTYEVIVQATETAYGFSKDAAQNHLDKITVDVTQPDETTVNIVVTNLEGTSPISGVGDIDLLISVPPNVQIEATGTVGDITIRDVQVFGMDVETTAGEIDFRGEISLEDLAPLRLTTTTGTIRLSLPADARVKIDAESSTSSISISEKFDQVTQEGGHSSSDSGATSWLGTLGTGSDLPTLRLRTTFGEVVVTPRDER